MPPSLLDLPAEVRRLIYFYLLDGRKVIDRSEHHPAKYHFQTNILQTCKTIHAEAAVVFRDTNHFVLVSYYPGFTSFYALMNWASAFFRGDAQEYKHPHVQLDIARRDEPEQSGLRNCLMLTAEDLPDFVMATITEHFEGGPAGHAVEIKMKPASYGPLSVTTQRWILEPLRLPLCKGQITNITGLDDLDLRRSMMDSLEGLSRSSKRHVWAFLDYVSAQGDASFRVQNYGRALKMYTECLQTMNYTEPGPQTRQDCAEYVFLANYALTCMFLDYELEYEWGHMPDAVMPHRARADKEARKHIPPPSQQALAWAAGAMEFCHLTRDEHPSGIANVRQWFEQALAEHVDNHDAITKCLALCDEFDSNPDEHDSLVVGLHRVMPRDPFPMRWGSEQGDGQRGEDGESSEDGEEDESEEF